VKGNWQNGLLECCFPGEQSLLQPRQVKMGQGADYPCNSSGHVVAIEAPADRMLLGNSMTIIDSSRQGARTCAGVRVESLTGPIPGQPGQVRVAGGQTVSASQAVVVATEAPAARVLLGNAMIALDSKTEEGVGTANLYFRYAWGLRTETLGAISPMRWEVSAA
jgi:hypothetical protein